MGDNAIVLTRRKVVGAFVALTVVFTLLTAWQANTSQDASHLSHENAGRISDISHERAARLRATRATALILCRAQNATNRSIVSFIVASQSPAALRKFAYYRDHPDEIPDLRAVRSNALAAFPQHDCQALPSSKLGKK